MEVAIGQAPFQREIREWQHIDENTGALLTARVESDRWANGPSNTYGKVTDSQNVTIPNGGKLSHRKQLEIIQARTSTGSIQVVKAQTVQSSSSRWSSSTSSPQNDQKNNKQIQHLLSPSLQFNNLTSSVSATTDTNSHNLNNNIKDSGFLSSITPYQHRALTVDQQQPKPDDDNLLNIPTSKNSYVGDQNHHHHHKINSIERETLTKSNRFLREKSNSTEDLTSNLKNGIALSTNNGNDIDTDYDDLTSWRRVSKIRRSLQFPKSTTVKLKENTSMLPDEYCVSISKIKRDLDNQRRLSAVMHNNNVDLEVLNNMLNGGDHDSDPNIINNNNDNNKSKQIKKTTLLTVESLKEVRNKLKRLSNESLYKDETLITIQMNGTDNNHNNSNDNVTEDDIKKNDKISELTKSSSAAQLITHAEQNVKGTLVNLTNENPLLVSIANVQPTTIKTSNSIQILNNNNNNQSHQSPLICLSKSISDTSIIKKDYDSKTLVHLNGGHGGLESGAGSIDNIFDEYNSSRQKRVEFCKTEVHFAAESGRVNIVETNEKRPPSKNFRRRRRNTHSLTYTEESTNTPISGDSITNNNSLIPNAIGPISNSSNLIHFGDEQLKSSNTNNYSPNGIDKDSLQDDAPTKIIDNNHQVTVITSSFSNQIKELNSNGGPYDSENLSSNIIDSKNDNNIYDKNLFIKNELLMSSNSSMNHIKDEISLRGILKNKPVKPKPYHLGDNNAVNDFLWGIKLKPITKKVEDLPAKAITNNDLDENKQENITVRISDSTSSAAVAAAPAAVAAVTNEHKISGYSTKIHLNSETDSKFIWNNSSSDTEKHMPNKPLTLRIGFDNDKNTFNNNNKCTNNGLTKNCNDDNQQNIDCPENGDNAFKSTSLIMKTIRSAQQFDEAMKKLVLIKKTPTPPLLLPSPSITASSSSITSSSSSSSSSSSASSALSTSHQLLGKHLKYKQTNSVNDHLHTDVKITLNHSDDSKLSSSHLSNDEYVYKPYNTIHNHFIPKNSVKESSLSDSHHKPITDDSLTKTISGQKPMVAPRFKKNISLTYPVPQSRNIYNKSNKIISDSYIINSDHFTSTINVPTTTTNTITTTTTTTTTTNISNNYDTTTTASAATVTTICNQLIPNETCNTRGSQKLTLNKLNNELLGSWSRIKAQKNMMTLLKPDDVYNEGHLHRKKDVIARSTETTTNPETHHHIDTFDDYSNNKNTIDNNKYLNNIIFTQNIGTNNDNATATASVTDDHHIYKPNTNKITSGVRPLRKHEFYYFGGNGNVMDRIINSTNSIIHDNDCRKHAHYNTIDNTKNHQHNEDYNSINNNNNKIILPSSSSSSGQLMPADQLSLANGSQLSSVSLGSSIKNKLSSIDDNKPDLLKHPNIENQIEYVNHKSISNLSPNSNKKCITTNNNKNNNNINNNNENDNENLIIYENLKNRNDLFINDQITFDRKTGYESSKKNSGAIKNNNKDLVDSNRFNDTINETANDESRKKSMGIKTYRSENTHNTINNTTNNNNNNNNNNIDVIDKEKIRRKSSSHHHKSNNEPFNSSTLSKSDVRLVRSSLKKDSNSQQQHQRQKSLPSLSSHTHSSRKKLPHENGIIDKLQQHSKLTKTSDHKKDISKNISNSESSVKYSKTNNNVSTSNTNNTNNNNNNGITKLITNDDQTLPRRPKRKEKENHSIPITASSTTNAVIHHHNQPSHKSTHIRSSSRNSHRKTADENNKIKDKERGTLIKKAGSSKDPNNKPSTTSSIVSATYLFQSCLIPTPRIKRQRKISKHAK